MANRALATQYTFTAGTSDEWTNPTNWSPTGTPMAGDEALVPASGTGTMTITGSSMSIGDLVFSSNTPQALANGGSDATNVTLTLTGNGSAPLIELNNGSLATQADFLIQGANGGAGTGTLGLVLGAGGQFNTLKLGPSLIISADISETGGPRSIEKSGSGTLVFSGSNSFSGAMTVTQGNTVWDYSQNAGQKIASTGSLIMNGGVLWLAGNSATSVSQTVNGLSVSNGVNALIVNPYATGQQFTLNVGAINRTQGSTIDFSYPNASGIITTTATNDSYGILGGWATVGSVDWATVSGGNIVALPAASYTDQPDVSMWGANENITNNSGAFTNTLPSSLTIGSLRFNNSSEGVVTIDGSSTLTVGSGGILSTTSGAFQINGGSLTSGNQELIVQNANKTAVGTINSVITDNSTGSVGLTKTGGGTIRITSNNTFSGHVIISGGSLSILSSVGDVGVASALGTGLNYATITIGNNGSTLGANSGGTPLASGTLDFQFNNGVVTRPIDLGTAGGGIRNAGTNNGTMTTISGPISGGSLLRFGVSGTTLISGTNNTYSGQTEVQAGTLDTMALAPIGTASSIGTGTSDPTLGIGSGGNTATFAYSGTTDASTGRNIFLIGGGTNFQIRNANTISFNSISEATGAGSFSKYGPGTIEFTGSGAGFSSRLNIARGTYQFDDPTGTGTGAASIDIGNGNAAALVYGGTTPATVSRPLDALSSTPTSTIQSNSTTMTVTGGFNANTSAHENLILSGAGGVIFNSNIFGTNAGTLTKSGTGTAELMGTDSYMNTTISGGTLILDNSSALGTGTVGILNSNSALALAGGFTQGVKIPSPDGFPFTNNGTINVNQGKIVVDYNSSSRYAALKTQVATGFNGGLWNGPGINSAAANAASATQHPMSVAIAEGSTIMGANYGASSGSYGGQTVDGTSVVLGYTYAGDATMNGTVDSNDFDVLAANFGTTGPNVGWIQGDFNYDGTVNALDFNALATNYGQPQLAAALPDGLSALGAVVPEPTGLAALAILSGLAIRRRRQGCSFVR